MARRSGLGKGLSALIPSEATGETDSALRVVPISHIKPNAFQPRSHFDEEAMSSLAASIREVGLLQPVLVREVDGEEESYELIAGERRWRAARRAGLQTIPVLVQPDTGDVTSLEQALVENLHREDLNALEEAAAYQQLIDEFGLTHEQVATRMGKGRATVTNTLRLLQLPAGAPTRAGRADHLGRSRPRAAGHPGSNPPGQAGRADHLGGIDGEGGRGDRPGGRSCSRNYVDCTGSTRGITRGIRRGARYYQ